MNLTWHVVKKDLRRFWLAGILLAGIPALKLILLHGVSEAEIGRDWQNRMNGYQYLLLMAQWILSFVVAVAVVHEDPVAEAGAFWEVLPIKRWQLLVAKVMALGVLTLLPVLLTVTVGWVALGLSMRLLCWPLAVIVQAQLAICVLGFTYGSLIKNIAHAIFWMIGVYMALLIPAIFQFQLGGGMGIPRLSHSTFFDGALIAAGIAVTLNQYLGRSRRRSIALLVVGVSCSVVMTMLFLSLDLTQMFFHSQRLVDQAISKLPVKITEGTIENLKVGFDARALVRVSIDDRSAPFFITQNGYFGKWTPSEGGPVYPQAKVYQAIYHANKRAILRAFGYTDPSLPSSLDIGAETLVSSSDTGRIRNQSLLYDGQIGFNVRSVAIEGEVDLVSSEKLESASGSVLIKRLEYGAPVVRVDIEARDSGMVADPGGFLGPDAEMGSVNYYSYVLVSHNSHTVLTASRNSTGISAYAYGASAVHEKLEFVLPESDRRNGGLAGWKLAQVRFGPNERAVRYFQQPLRLEEVPAIALDPSWLK